MTIMRIRDFWLLKEILEFLLSFIFICLHVSQELLSGQQFLENSVESRSSDREEHREYRNPSLLILCNRIEITLLDDRKQDNSKNPRAGNWLCLLELLTSKVLQTPSLRAIASSINYPPDLIEKPHC